MARLLLLLLGALRSAYRSRANLVLENAALRHQLGILMRAPLEHQHWVVSAAFSPDGARVVTASGDRTARVWDVRLDEGTVEQWAAIAERSPFVLDGVALVRRSALRPPSKIEE